MNLYIYLYNNLMYGFLDCKLMPRYLSGYAGGQKMEFKSLFEAKAKCLQGKYELLKFSCKGCCILDTLQKFTATYSF